MRRTPETTKATWQAAGTMPKQPGCIVVGRFAGTERNDHIPGKGLM